MTAHKDLKTIIRTRQEKTGESYTSARQHVMRDRANLLGLDLPQPDARGADAIVLKVNSASARVRIFGEAPEVTFRCSDIWRVVPGHVVTLSFDKRWTWKGHAYASGQVKNPRIDIPRLGLEPLPLTGGELIDLREADELEEDDPYAALWNKHTVTPRGDYEMDPITWGAFPGADEEDNLTCDAAARAEAGDHKGARELT